MAAMSSNLGCSVGERFAVYEEVETAGTVTAQPLDPQLLLGRQARLQNGDIICFEITPLEQHVLPGLNAAGAAAAAAVHTIAGTHQREGRQHRRQRQRQQEHRYKNLPACFKHVVRKVKVRDEHVNCLAFGAVKLARSWPPNNKKKLQCQKQPITHASLLLCITRSLID